MSDSWLGIVDRHGLNLLVRETEHGLYFVQRRAARLAGVTCWAILTDAHAVAIQEEIKCGSASIALQLLECLATDLGRILPEPSELPEWNHET
ncbi:MAG: hypothetical protein KDA92_02435 [Planctomycetales bacterium]|nr:hypothetical protein [Planctomycetales bacterium]MCA9166548.1 hypothetical protein [Planctomycetales bacterium]